MISRSQSLPLHCVSGPQKKSTAVYNQAAMSSRREPVRGGRPIPRRSAGALLGNPNVARLMPLQTRTMPKKRSRDHYPNQAIHRRMRIVPLAGAR